MKQLHMIILIFVVALGVYVGLNLNNESQIETTNADSVTIDTSTDEPEATQEKKKASNYQIVHSIETRYDGGISYYVLLPPVDLNNSAYVDNVKYIINELTSKNGSKISIELFDDINALELSYKQYGDLSLGRTLTESENQWQGIHYIAAYSGDLETGFYLNTLYFFPSASSDHPQVGKYVSMTEYNPG